MVSSLGNTQQLSMRLLGGFHVERAGAACTVGGWQRRSAKTLTKLLATSPGHMLHREQITEILWPGAEIESALNSLGKALHAARHAFEPELPRRTESAYLRMTEAMVALNTEYVAIDVDHFERLAKEALRCRDAAVYEAALAAYGGELLPEDRYAEWCAERRRALAELRIRLLLGLAMTLEKRGACNEAAERLRAILTQDPTREDVHRYLMRMYAGMGTPDQAMRQFRLCQEVLRRELDLSPQPETVSLYHDILKSRVLPQPPAAARQVSDLSRRSRPAHAPSHVVADVPSRMPFIGRERVFQQIYGLLRATRQHEGMVLVTGEAGVGKTRILDELAVKAGSQGATVLASGRGAHARRFACGLFAVALENYAASLSEAERAGLGHRYPALARIVPSLYAVNEVPATAGAAAGYHLDLIPAVVRMLTDLARRQPVLLVLGDLHDADQLSLDLLRYLAQLAKRHQWLIVGAVRDGEVVATTGLGRMIESTIREGLCLKISLDCLSRTECDQLVRAMFTGTSAGQLAEQIYHWSGGNPLLIEELVREMRESAANPAGRRDPARIPARVRALTEMRIASLDEATRRVLRLMAVADTAEISLSRLCSGAAALDPPVQEVALFGVLDRALEIGLLEERATGYAFRHPLIKAALYEGLSRHRRIQLQTALAGSQCLEPESAAYAAGS